MVGPGSDRHGYMRHFATPSWRWILMGGGESNKVTYIFHFLQMLTNKWLERWERVACFSTAIMSWMMPKKNHWSVIIYNSAVCIELHCAAASYAYGHFCCLTGLHSAGKVCHALYVQEIPTFRCGGQVCPSWWQERVPARVRAFCEPGDSQLPVYNFPSEHNVQLNAQAIKGELFQDLLAIFDHLFVRVNELQYMSHNYLF